MIRPCAGTIRAGLLFPALAVLLIMVPAAVADAGRSAEAEAASSHEAGWRAFPEELLYTPYLADPGRPHFALAFASVDDVGVADSGNARHLVSLGARAGLARWTSRAPRALAVQVDLYAGFNGQFDRDYSNDNIGWDGVYGLLGTMRVTGTLALRTGVAHVSSHVGDEYAERTGRQRINYTREELLVGASWKPLPRWRVYAELGAAYDLRNEALQEEGRWQVGAEYQLAEGLWRTSLGWYAAVDLQGMEERDGEVDLSARVGLNLPGRSRDWRVGLAWYDGRVPIGEFFQDDQSYLAFGLWLDI